jgi:predicted RNA-binding Zn-ribbon protein involved in translation (DUF1610 family)
VASYVKLRDGSRGLRGRPGELAPGLVVRVTGPGAGPDAWETVGRVTWQGASGMLATIREATAPSPDATVACPGCGRVLIPGDNPPARMACPGCGREVVLRPEAPSLELQIDRAAAQLGRVSMLQYDIPDSVDVANPSGILRRLGIRVTLSVWAVQEARMPWPLIDRMGKAGCKVFTVRFDPEEAPKLISLAITSLREDIAEARASLQASLDWAAEDLQDSDESPDKAEKAYRRRTRAAIGHAEKLLEDLQEAAEAFGVAGPITQDMAQARARIGGLRAATQARASMYLRLAERQKEGPLKRAAMNGDVPAGVLADALEDDGEDTTAERAAFE